MFLLIVSATLVYIAANYGILAGVLAIFILIFSATFCNAREAGRRIVESIKLLVVCTLLYLDVTGVY